MARPPSSVAARPDCAKSGFALFSHDADIGVRGFGPSLSESFVQAACALTTVVTDRPVAAREAVDILCAAPSPELLLVDWLNALIFEMSVRAMLFGRFEVAISNGQLSGRAWGEPLNVSRHAPAVEPKGATYTGLHVEQDAETGVWSAACVVDV